MIYILMILNARQKKLFSLVFLKLMQNRIFSLHKRTTVIHLCMRNDVFPLNSINSASLIRSVLSTSSSETQN